MNYTEILEFIRAGYTKAEIDALQGMREEAVIAEPEITAEPEQPVEANINDILAKMNKTIENIALLQGMNAPKKESAEDVLAEMLKGVKINNG